MSDFETALDVWLRIPADDNPEDESNAEANTYATQYGFRVEWYLTSVGLVTSVFFDTYAEAAEWLESEGFVDYSS